MANFVTGGNLPRAKIDFTASLACVLALIGPSLWQAQTLPLLAFGTLDGSRGGPRADASGLRYTLENGAPTNLLGGLGSALAYASGVSSLALPDRDPNALDFNDAIDNTASYVNRYHTVKMHLEPNTTGTGLPFTLTPSCRHDTAVEPASTSLRNGRRPERGFGRPED